VSYAEIAEKSVVTDSEFVYGVLGFWLGLVYGYAVEVGIWEKGK